MGHANIQTTMIYADYAPDATGGRDWVEKAFSRPENAALTASIDRLTALSPLAREYLRFL